MMRAVSVVAEATCLTIVCAAHAAAGGLWFYEQSTPDQGTAAAGRAILHSHVLPPEGPNSSGAQGLMICGSCLRLPEQTRTYPELTQNHRAWRETIGRNC